ncbi:MAG: histidine phosphatase family protein [Thermoplasmata archaeon]|nr:histidine phosphatase family protein [Thermoplasmata archaeon]
MTEPDRVRILLARHGQSTWNAIGRWQGRADPPLSELGERQAEDVVTVLRSNGEQGSSIGRIWASPLQRARQTAEIIGRGIGLGLETDARLQEWDAGEWTGLTRVEIEDRWPGYLAERRRPPGFETDGEVITRALAALHAITAASTAGTVLVVTHGGLIRSIERHLEAPEVPPVPNLGARELFSGDAGVELGERVLLLDPDDVEVTTPRQM